MDKRHVLLVGKSQLVLKTAVEMLHKLGYKAEATNNFIDDITTQFDMRTFDLVVFGGQVPEDKKTEMKQAISALKADVIFVQGLAGIPGLIVQQIEGAFAADHQNASRAPHFNAHKRAITFTLDQPAEVVITVWWQTSFVPPDPLSDSQVLIDELLPAGEHEITIPDHIPNKAAFTSVKIDKAIYTFSVVSV